MLSNYCATSGLPTLPQGRLRRWGSAWCRSRCIRVTRMLMAGHTYGCTREAALIAALTQTPDILIRRPPKHIQEARERVLGDRSDSDFFILMLAWRYAQQHGYRLDACQRLGIHAGAVRQVAPSASSFYTWQSTRAHH